MIPKIRILYAEDNPQDADLTRAHFAEFAPEFAIEIANSGQGCLDRLREAEFDLLLLDYRLPDIDGLSVLKALVHTGLRLPVVFVTGKCDEELVVNALRLGAANYVPKQGNYLEILPNLLSDVLRDHQNKQCRGLLAIASTCRILYIEHNTMDIDLTLQHFAEAAPHFLVDVVCTCAEALARLEQPHEYDLVLIDLRMPDQNGLDFTREAKIRHLRLPPFVMISGRGDEAAAIATLKLGAADYIAKREGYLKKLVYTINQAIAYDRINRLNEQLQIELKERKRVEEVLVASETRYRSLFEDSPISLWEEDFSGCIEYFSKLRASGITDLRTHLKDHPKELQNCIQLIKILDVNKATIGLYEAPDRATLLSDLSQVLTEKSFEAFKEILIALFEGAETHECETVNKSISGKLINVLLRWSVLPKTMGQHYHALISITDISDRLRAEEQQRASLKEKELLLREIHHRTKNNMAVITGLLRLQASEIKDNRYLDMFKDCQDRIASMALVHEKLYQSKSFGNINFGEYIDALVSNIFDSHRDSAGGVRLRIEIDGAELDLENAIPCGLVINELVTNSLKYAFPNGRGGELMVAFHSINNDEFELVVSDNGSGIPENIDITKSKTLGLRLVTILVEQQLDGNIKLDRSGGTSWHISIKRQNYRARV